jgi:hypothetical protein
MSRAPTKCLILKTGVGLTCYALCIIQLQESSQDGERSDRLDFRR